jgi:lipopolysaccharide export system protein LptA
VKNFSYIALIALAGAGTLHAQTNTTAITNTNAMDEILALVTTNAPAAKPPARSETVIESDGPADFEQTEHGGKVIYRDHVRVDAPDLKLRCEWLVADLSQASGRVTNIVAETNVVIDATDEKGQKMHATGEKTVYVFALQNGVTNETVTLTGDAKAEYKQITLTGDVIIWDRANNRLYVPSNPKMVLSQTLNGALAGTNSPTVTTDSSPTTNSAGMDTNSPPAMTNQPAASK